METKNLGDLKANPKNPRQISREDFESLKRSLIKFGDLSSIIFNRHTKQLAGGHMRQKAFEAMTGEKKIIITQTFDAPNQQGTVALGYVDFQNEHYNYREVDWAPEFEAAANIAANRIGGSFDLDLLAQVNYEISQLENGKDLLDATGQSEDEYKKLIDMVAGEPNIELPEGEKDGFQNMTFTLSDEQSEIVNEAMENIKATQSFEGQGNQNSNGNALYFLAKIHLDRLHGEPGEPSQTN